MIKPLSSLILKGESPFNIGVEMFKKFDCSISGLLDIAVFDLKGQPDKGGIGRLWLSQK